MDTVTIKAGAAAVTGARHQRCSRNGQDAAIGWATSAAADRPSGRAELGLGVAAAGGSPHANPSELGSAVAAAGAQANPSRRRELGLGVAVVADGCSSGASSEVGARLGAALFARALAARLLAGAPVTAIETWTATRSDVARALADLVERMPGDRAQAIHDQLLFTIVAAAATHDGAAVWALGDGAYSFGGGTHVLGPFADNAPPYLAYDLLGDPQPAWFAVAPASCETIVIATDGALDIAGGLECFVAAKYVEHRDALRRKLALLARTFERIDWDERRVVRTPAVLQDDCAIGVLRWSAS